MNTTIVFRQNGTYLSVIYKELTFKVSVDLINTFCSFTGDTEKGLKVLFKSILVKSTPSTADEATQVVESALIKELKDMWNYEYSAK